MISLQFTSQLAATPESVWQYVTTATGINHELAPWIKMTLPSTGLDITNITPGQALGKSWLLLGGLLPVEYDDLCIAEIRPFYFRETSSMLSQQHWQHERSVHAMVGGCWLQDRLQFQPRLGLLSAPAKRITTALFQHRHKRLRENFGTF